MTGFGVLLIVLGVLAFGTGWAIKGELPYVGAFPLSEWWENRSWLRERQLIDLVPLDADMLVRVRIGEDEEQVQLFQDLWHLFPKSGQWDTSLNSWLNPTGTSGEPTVTWDQDVKPWIGSEIGIVARQDGSTETSANQIATAFIFPTSDPEQTRLFLDKLITEEGAKATTSTYQDVSITLVEIQTEAVEVLPDANSLQDESNPTTGGQGHIALLGKYLVVANTEQLLRDAIDCYQGEDNFKKKENYTMVAQQMGSEALTTIYADADFLAGQIRSLAGDGVFGFLNEAANWLYPLTDYSLLGFQLVTTADGLQIVQTGVKQLQSEAEVLNVQNFSPALVQAIPETAAMYIGGKDIKSGIERLVRNMALSDPTVETQYENLIATLATDPYGLDWEIDVWGWMPGEYALVLAPGESGPFLSFLTTVEDSVALEGRVRTLITILYQYLNAGAVSSTEESASWFSEQVIQGTTVTVATHPQLPATLQLSYVLLGNTLVISNQPQGLEPFIAVNRGDQGSLFKNVFFMAMREVMPGETGGMTYVNRQYLWDALASVYELFPAISGTGIPLEAVETDLEPAQGAMATYVPAEKMDSWKLLVHISQ